MLDETLQEEQQLTPETQQPEQSGEFPRWEYPVRREPEWGEITKQGLVVGRGTNKKTIPPDEVYKLASLGCSVTEMSEWFQVSQSTLKYNFGDYIKKGKEDIKNKLRDAQMKLALSGNATMLIWLGKNMLGQEENPTNKDDSQPLPWNDDVKLLDDIGNTQDTD